MCRVGLIMSSVKRLASDLRIVLLLHSVCQGGFKQWGIKLSTVDTINLLSWNRLKVVPALLHAIPKLDTVY